MFIRLIALAAIYAAAALPATADKSAISLYDVEAALHDCLDTVQTEDALFIAPTGDVSLYAQCNASILTQMQTIQPGIQYAYATLPELDVPAAWHVAYAILIQDMNAMFTGEAQIRFVEETTAWDTWAALHCARTVALDAPRYGEDAEISDCIARLEAAQWQTLMAQAAIMDPAALQTLGTRDLPTILTGTPEALDENHIQLTDADGTTHVIHVHTPMDMPFLLDANLRYFVMENGTAWHLADWTPPAYD